MDLNKPLKYTFFSMACILCACSASGINDSSSSKEAVIDAKKLMLATAASVKNHVPIKDSEITTSQISRNNDGGWDITLKAKTCTYIIYSNPGKGMDVEGMDAGCLHQ